jgi:tetratricopeptide (TPR) repeat protein
MSDSQEHLINHYKKALLIKPDHPEIYNRLAECYYKQGQFKAAIEACQTALKFQPNLLKASKTLAMSLQEQGEVEAAFEIYKTLGDRLYKEEQLEEAITAYYHAIELKPDAYEAYYKLGEVLQRQSKLEEAISFYLKAIEVQPLFKLSYYKINSFLHEILINKETENNSLAIGNIKIFNNAKQCLLYATKRQPEFSLAHVCLGNLFTLQGNLEKAISAYQTASYQQLLTSHPNFIKNDWNSQNPRQPHFLIIGTMKGGTTSLYSYLVHHPQVLPAIEKEINFFAGNKFELGMDWYLAHFPPIPKGSTFFTGEATPWYYLICEIDKIAHLFPEIKLILILRNPINRACSHYQMFVNGGREKRSLSEVITSEIKVINTLSNPGLAGAEYWQREKGYLLYGLYVYFLEKWMAIFPREQFLIVKSEDFYVSPATTLTQVFEFLGVPDYPLPEYRNYNPGSYQPISDDLRQMLADFFRPHNQKLEEYLGMKFDWDD